MVTPSGGREPGDDDSADLGPVEGFTDDADAAEAGKDPDADAWESIVASFDQPSAPVGHWPASEDLDTRWEPPTREPSVEQEQGDEYDESQAQLEPDEGHFVPPPPPPIPVVHPLTLWSWIALIAGIVALLGSPLLGYELSGGWALVAVLLLVGGFVSLVARMRDSPPTDSGPDDGAVV